MGNMAFLGGEQARGHLRGYSAGGLVRKARNGTKPETRKQVVKCATAWPPAGT